MKRVCVFCGSSPGKKPVFRQMAVRLGKEISDQNLDLVYGGSNIGLMGILARSVLEGNGRVTGVIPQYIHEKVPPLKISELIIVDGMHARKSKMYELSDGFIIFPGGIGTLEEFFEIYTWQGLNMHSKPIGLFNLGGYYNKLIDFLDQCVDEGFLKQIHRRNLIIGENPPNLLKQMINFKPEKADKWL